MHSIPTAYAFPVCNFYAVNTTSDNINGRYIGLVAEMEFIKWLHVTCVFLSGIGFFIRGIFMLRESALLQTRAVKIFPHVIDTLLLVSAIILASQWGWAALKLPWLQAKIMALLIYIGLGGMALRTGRSKKQRVLAWWAAMLVFVYIVAVALSKDPLLNY